MTSPINLYGWEQFLHLGAIWKKWPWTLNDHFKVCIRSLTRQPSLFKANRRLHLFILCSLVFAPVIVPEVYRQRVSLYQLIVWTSWFYTTYHSALLLWTVRRLMLFWTDFTLVYIAGFFFIRIYLGCLSCCTFAHLCANWDSFAAFHQLFRWFIVIPAPSLDLHTHLCSWNI